MAAYEGINLAELVEENERLDAQGGNTDFLENFVLMPEKEGFVTVRLLPPGLKKKFFCATRTHRVNKRSVHCPRVLVTNKNGNKVWQDEDFSNPCVICKYYNDLWSQADSAAEAGDNKKSEDLKTQARQIKPVERYYYNAIVRTFVNKAGETEKNVGPKILSIGKMLHQRIVRAIVGDQDNDEKPLGDITDLKQGRDFKIIKKLVASGKDMYPNYNESKFLDPSPLGDKDQIELWLGNLHDLASLRVIKTTEEMKTELKKHLGIIKDDKTGFDMSEFQKKPDVTLEEQVREVQHKVEKPKNADAVLAEEDFLKELNSL